MSASSTRVDLLRRASMLAAALAVNAVLAGAGDPPVLAVRGVRILSVSAGELQAMPRGTVVMRAGKIEAAGEDAPVPADAQVLDLDGRWVLPGFIDAHSQTGVRGESDEPTWAVTEDLRLLDAYDPWDPEIERLLESGVTSIALSPGDRNVAGGAVAIVKLAPGRVPVPIVRERAALKASLSRAVLGGPMSPRFPTSASGAIALFRSWLAGEEEAPCGSPLPGPPAGGPSAIAARDLPVLVRVETRTSAEAALDALSAEGRAAVLLGGPGMDEATWTRLAPPCPVVLGPFGLDDPPRVLAAAAAIERRKVPLAFAGSGDRRDLLTSAVLAMRAGLSRTAALAALTEAPARIYGVEGRIGRIAPGADADLVVWSGDPFTVAARTEVVIVDGRIAFRRESPPPGLVSEVRP